MRDILGQDPALDVLRDALASDRVHHAWIFAGPRGVGKFTTALAFATLLLDPDAGPNLAGELEADPDGPVARQIRAGTYPDLHVIRKELALYSDRRELRTRKLANLPLDVLREHMIGGRTGDGKYHEPLVFHTSALGHNKVFIIDEAELIDRFGQNALLKTLEEPPPKTFLFLVTWRPEYLLPTIHSRCQIVRFGRLDAAAMEAWLDRQDDDATRNLTPDERRMVIDFADGAPGAARLAIDHDFPLWQGRFEPMIAELDRGGYPVAMGPALAEFVETFATTWVKTHDNASKDAANKDGARHVFTLLAHAARRRLASAIDDPDAMSRAVEVIDRLRHAERQLESNVNAKQVLENVVAQWASVASVG